jgi:hypothetical protein
MPESRLAQFGFDRARTDFADTAGWPELAAQVRDAFFSLTPDERSRAAIVASNYGEAGAIDLFGAAMGLPAALSPHLTYWYWKPEHVAADTLVLIGYSEDAAHRLCRDVTVASRLTNSVGVLNEEVNRPIVICRDLVQPLDVVWPRLQSFR